MKSERKGQEKLIEKIRSAIGTDGKQLFRSKLDQRRFNALEKRFLSLYEKLNGTFDEMVGLLQDEKKRLEGLKKA